MGHKKKKFRLDQISIDPQDPLPESNWFFRRLVLIGSLAFLLLQRSWEEYYHIFNTWTDYLILSILILYTVAPSAEQVAKMFGMVSLFSPGRTFKDMIKEHDIIRSAPPQEQDEEDDNEGELPIEQRVKRPREQR